MVPLHHLPFNIYFQLKVTNTALWSNRKLPFLKNISFPTLKIDLNWNIQRAYIAPHFVVPPYVDARIQLTYMTIGLGDY